MIEPVVYLVDDDSAIRDSYSMLFRSVGLAVKVFDHPEEFLKKFDHETVGCLVLDIRMPGASGLTVHEQLLADGCSLPVIFITGHGDVAQCRTAFKNGALDFLTKPVDEQPLLDSVQKAIQVSIKHHRQSAIIEDACSRISRLTEREIDVLRLIVDGQPNKVIAQQLNLSIRTIENHRAAIFEKSGVDSLAQLVRIYLKIESTTA